MSTSRLLVDSGDDVISRGNVFRVPGKYPYEKFVDFMVFETSERKAPYGLIVTSGYKAGLILIVFPNESLVEGGVGLQWVKANWKEWVYMDCEVSDVYLIDAYEAFSLG